LKNFVPVTVIVTDVNDHPPEFIQEQYYGVVFDDYPIGYSIPLNIKAVDKDDGINAVIKYFLNGSDANCFSIDHVSGSISLQCDISRRRKKSFELEVVAIDRNGSGNEASAKLSVVVVPHQVSVETGSNVTQLLPSNDSSFDSACRLEFSSDLVDVVLVEHAPLSSPVYIATLSYGRQTCAKVTFGFGDNSALPYFNIDPSTGLISVSGDIDIRRLERQGLLSGHDPRDSVMLNISATAYSPPDSDKLQAFMRVRVHVYGTEQRQDGGVAFVSSSYSFTLKENQKPGTYVGQVVAKYQRTDDIQYTLLYSQLFEIANSSNVTVKIEDVNDNSPVFTKGIYLVEIPEGPYGNGAVIGFVKATDRDSGENGNVYYYTPDSEIPFNVSEDGNIFCYGTIDREMREVYEFAVQVNTY
uniref:CA domain-containing protein n=1 Tax=Soboliphyme baturini TaxID=241478 RepID=A0A183J592_9BILA